MKILITGGSKGIGKAIKNRLNQEGYEVYDFSRTNKVDLMTEEGIKFTVDYLRKGYFDILVNNVGGGGTWSYMDKKLVMDKNFWIMEELTNAFLYSKPKWGRVITISSIYGKEKGHNSIFTSVKASQIAYMKCLAGTVKGVTFNTICPGHIDVGKPFPDKPKVIGKPEDVAGIVTFLCSDEASHINGATISVDGGVSHSW